MAAGDRKRGWGPHEFVACAPDLAAGVTWGGSGRQLRSPCFVDLGTASVFGILRKKNSQGLPQAEPNPKGQATVDLQSVWAMTPFSKMDTNLRCQSYPAARRNGFLLYQRNTPSVKKKRHPGFPCPIFDCPSYMNFFIISIFIIVR
uniref:Uncharacterized protein n=1 Tax=Oryza rufipogon TaxID=4529 RepID=A0A0E0Q7H0_ORYRU